MYIYIYIYIYIPLTQVLSKTVADLFDYFGDESTTEAKKFVMMFDRLFDCLNVRDLHQWVHKLKPDLQPYQSADDPRLKVYQMCRVTA